jgi:hypothetical protein
MFFGDFNAVAHDINNVGDVLRVIVIIAGCSQLLTDKLDIS